MVLGTHCPSSCVEYCLYKENLSIDKQVKQRRRQERQGMEHLVFLHGDGWKTLGEWTGLGDWGERQLILFHCFPRPGGHNKSNKGQPQIVLPTLPPAGPKETILVAPFASLAATPSCHRSCQQQHLCSCDPWGILLNSQQKEMKKSGAPSSDSTALEVFSQVSGWPDPCLLWYPSLTLPT